MAPVEHRHEGGLDEPTQVAGYLAGRADDDLPEPSPLGAGFVGAGKCDGAVSAQG